MTPETAAVLLSVLAVLIAAGGTFLQNRRATEALTEARKVSQAQVDAQLALTREERQQRRLEQAYERLLQSLDDSDKAFIETAQAVLAVARNRRVRMPSELPVISGQPGHVYWSTAVRALVTQWRMDSRPLRFAHLALERALLHDERHAFKRLKSEGEYATAHAKTSKTWESIRHQVRTELIGDEA